MRYWNPCALNMHGKGSAIFLLLQKHKGDKIKSGKNDIIKVFLSILNEINICLFTETFALKFSQNR